LLAGCVTLGAGDEAPLERVWQATRVWLPSAPGVSGHRVREVERALEAIPAETRWPVVIYVHGCHGLDDDLTQWAGVLTAAGYAVVAPAASTRGERAPRCNDATLYGRDDLVDFARRAAEVRYAHRQLLMLRWVVPQSVFLFGFDHGGVIVADWRQRDVAGYIVTGWTCTSPDMRHGLFTPPDRPVLAIRWAEDPLFRDPAWNGDCEAHLAERPGSRSLVLEGRGHSTATSPEARAAVLRFLHAHTAR